MKYLNKAIKIVIYTAFFCILLISFASLYVYFKKDKIVPFVVEKLNTRIKGDIEYDEIKLSSFSDLSTISILITKPSFLLKNDANVDTLMKFDQLDLEFDIFKLLRSEIDIEALTFHDGEINFTQLADSSYSIINALSSNTVQVDTSQKDYKISLDLNKLRAQNIRLKIKPLQKSDLLITTIGNFQASIFYTQDSLSSLIDMNSTINELQLNKMNLFSQQDFSINTTFSYSIKHNTLYIAESTIEFMEAIFTSDGTIEFEAEKKINLQFSADDKDLKFTKLFLSEAADSLIEKGNIYLKGAIKGKLSDQLPEITCNFGSKDLTLIVPRTQGRIEDLNITGFFSSGNKRDLSRANLRIDSISGRLPEGYIKGKLNMQNVKDPYLEYSFDLKTRLDGFDQLIATTAFDSLTGLIDLNGKYEGYTNNIDSLTRGKVDSMQITLANVSFNLGNEFRFHHINGHIHTNNARIEIDSARLELNNTAIKLKGNIENYFALIIDNNEASTANLDIRSPLFDYPLFFSYSDAIASSFPYKIEELVLKVSISSSKKGLSSFYKLPSIDFRIDQLKGNIPSICPPIDLKGDFKLGDDHRISQLEFSDFLLNVGANQINLDLLYAYSDSIHDSLAVSLKLDSFNVGKNVFFSFLDPLRDSTVLILDGDLSSTIVWEIDSSNAFKTLNFSFEDIDFIHKTFSLKSHNSTFNAIDIRDLNSSNFPLSTLSGRIDIDFEKIYTPFYEDENIRFEIDIDDGRFKLNADYSQDPNDNLKIYLDSRPFDSIPSYNVKHSSKNTDIQKVFPPRKDDESLLFGDTDLEIDVSFGGKTIDEVFNSINGRIILKGDSMVVSGYDIDKLIAKFQRSQNFNLVDLGAVLVAGPVGILYTKGSDYAMMLVGNKKDSSIIDEYYSGWYVENGVFVVKDFAFSTDENRIAFEGWVDMAHDSLDITIALVDTLGCSIVSQNLKGNFDNPKAGKVKYVKTAIAPVTNMVDKALHIDCDVFYDGVVKPTIKKKKINID